MRVEFLLDRVNEPPWYWINRQYHPGMHLHILDRYRNRHQGMNRFLDFHFENFELILDFHFENSQPIFSGFLVTPFSRFELFGSVWAVLEVT